MNRVFALGLVVLFVVVPSSLASAQILMAKDAAIVYGHHHLNATSIDEHKKFWVDTLGGTAIKAGTFDVITFPNVLIFLNARAPNGPTKGSSLNHIGFSVPNLRRVVDRVKANGFRMVTAEEAPAGVTVKDDIGVTGSGIAYALGPDGVKVELLQVDRQSAPIAHHHIHFFGDQPAEMRAWCMKVFGATPRQTQVNGIIGADLPAGGLNFSQSPGPLPGTRGRALDH